MRLFIIFFKAKGPIYSEMSVYFKQIRFFSTWLTCPYFTAAGIANQSQSTPAPSNPLSFQRDDALSD